MIRHAQESNVFTTDYWTSLNSLDFTGLIC